MNTKLVTSLPCFENLKLERRHQTKKLQIPKEAQKFENEGRAANTGCRVGIPQETEESFDFQFSYSAPETSNTNTISPNESFIKIYMNRKFKEAFRTYAGLPNSSLVIYENSFNVSFDRELYAVKCDNFFLNVCDVYLNIYSKKNHWMNFNNYTISIHEVTIHGITNWRIWNEWAWS